MEKEIINFAEAPLPIKHLRIDMAQGSGYRAMHFHPAVELVRVERGRLNCCVENQTLQLDCGQIILINRNTAHRLQPGDGVVSYIQVDLNFFMEGDVEHHLSSLYRFIFHTKDKPYAIFHGDREMAGIFEKIESAYYQKQAGSRWYLRAHVCELIAFMCRHALITTPALSAKQIEKISPIVGYIDLNFRGRITLDEICAEVNYSKYSLCHCFKAVTGATVLDYVNYLRVSAAVERLKQRDGSILSVATECGFSSPTYFNRVFKGVMGCSPSAYRKFLDEKAVR